MSPNMDVVTALMEEAASLIKEGVAQVRYLLDTHHLWSDEGTYTFPDGDTVYRDYPFTAS